MKDNKIWLIISGISGFLAVAIGAFGAHGLRSSLLPEMMDVYKTGVLYHLIHSAVLLAISLNNIKRFYPSAVFFLAGIVLFSFSLYLYALTGITALAIITPFGGVSLLIGWLLIVIQTVKSKGNNLA
ncbi:MAG: DUF423 domain-containing protein [Ignavibacteriaceae bacterium]|nr:DUF423 domain-containing protein [Ignavibacteriaceae bacterium]